MIHKVDTFKAGRFAFSSDYDEQRIGPLLIEARVLKETVADLPVLPAYAAQLESEVIRRSIFGTAAVEGNPLSEDQVGEILSGEDRDQHLAQAEQEIFNLQRAYAAARDFGSRVAGQIDHFIITEEFIRDMHAAITAGIDHPQNEPGSYRNHPVEVSDKKHGGVYRPPKALADIQTLMGALTEWLNSDALLALEPPLRAALAHYHLGLIHPFSDGNGRTARLLEAVMLEARGVKRVPLMLSNYYYAHIDEYYWAFSLSRRSKACDVTPFLEFVLQAFCAALREMKANMSLHIRLLALRDHVSHLRQARKLTARQHNFLELLLDKPYLFTLSELWTLPAFAALYRDVSERTGRRDLAKLSDMRLLIRDEKGKYRLNLHALDQS